MRRTSWRALLSLLVAVVAMSAATVASAAGGPHDKRGGHGHGHGHGDHHPPPPPAAKEPTAVGSGGAAATVDLLATQAAIDMMRRGGNAVDAAVAAAGVLGVTEPFSSGIGGGGFMVIRTPRGQVTTIDSREKAPASHDARTRSSRTGRRCRSTTPGSAGCPPASRARSPAGSTRSSATAARRSARRCSPASRSRARASWSTRRSSTRRTAVVDYFNDVPSTAAIYLDPDGTPRDVGTTLRNPDMARAYDMIARYGANGFYRGPIASRDGQRGAEPADRRRRQPRLAHRA